LQHPTDRIAHFGPEQLIRGIVAKMIIRPAREPIPALPVPGAPGVPG